VVLGVAVVGDAFAHVVQRGSSAIYGSCRLFGLGVSIASIFGGTVGGIRTCLGSRVVVVSIDRETLGGRGVVVCGEFSVDAGRVELDAIGV